MTDAPAPTERAIALVLAAGLGTRMRSKLPKLLHPLLGRPMLAYALDAAVAATGRRPVVVTSPATAAIRDVFAEVADFGLQPEPIGTGDAVRAGLGALPADVDVILVLNGDVPRMHPELPAALLAERRASGVAVAITSVETPEPGSLGRVVRDVAGQVTAIVEAKDATEDQLDIAEINAGIYAFEAAWLRRRIGDLRPSPATGELYLTDLVRFAHEDGAGVTAIVIEDDGRLLGINDRLQLAEAEGDLRAEINERHLLAGVTMDDPSTAYIEPTVELAQDVTIGANVRLRGRTRVGEGTTIGAGSDIVDTVIGRDCRIVSSVIESSTVEDEVDIGPFAHVRPGSSIGSRAKLGNYAEIKNTRLGEGVQQHHMSYLGDADVGARTNIGAGTITANYDGTRKHRTKIGERVFLGVDSMLVAPLEIGDGAKTGAGAVVTHDVPAGKLAVGVPARLREPRPPATGEGGPER
ncbi:MAG TPA: bifunctional UDP-N-acetylglucosamine diphosphorylase/glucosamine-1-phosphate N-acetyltransferase GlmU [Candidatus Limnocylindrales bacterium]